MTKQNAVKPQREVFGAEREAETRRLRLIGPVNADEQAGEVSRNRQSGVNTGGEGVEVLVFAGEHDAGVDGATLM